MYDILSTVPLSREFLYNNSLILVLVGSELTDTLSSIRCNWHIQNTLHAQHDVGVVRTSRHIPTIYNKSILYSMAYSSKLWP